ncbi:alpha/beta hydrolase [Alteromonas flava]|uniref:alpha/beta hydrolase n=1 Tax=Alteromonas flava TaxID=2048003 RepID=UPI000C2888BA|nr:alpha/beta hydrolase-fold protein [Alteromonas flava]
MSKFTHFFVIAWLASQLGSNVSQAADQIQSTASNRVSVINTLRMPYNDQIRKVRIYLPQTASAANPVPVLYLHDGQNVFDKATAYVEEWRVDEILDNRVQLGLPVPMVVAIDHGGENRIRELSSWDHEQYGSALGNDYLAFILSVVKPYIESNYPVLIGADNTAIMGSSMGGLMSHYAIHQYPDVFSKAGVFSPSFWYAEEAFSLVQQQKLNPKQRVFTIMGAKEGDSMLLGWQRMQSVYAQQAIHPNQIRAVLVPDGEHNEALWSAQFETALNFLFNYE